MVSAVAESGGRGGARRAGGGQSPQKAPAKTPFKLEEVMIPVRDGVRLQTAILTPVISQGRCRFCYGAHLMACRPKPPERCPRICKELAQDGYIFVIQNLRGRFKSEGVFKLSSQVDLNDPKARMKRPTRTTPSIGW